MIEATRILTEKIKRKEYKFSDTFNNWITHKFKKIMKDESNYVKKHYLNK
jgi:hypothetical protein